jgi:hypothetical protein
MGAHAGLELNSSFSGNEEFRDFSTSTERRIRGTKKLPAKIRTGQGNERFAGS